MTRSRRLPASQPSLLLFSAALIASVLAHALVLSNPRLPGWLSPLPKQDQRPLIITLQNTPAAKAPKEAPRLAEHDSEGSANTLQDNQHRTIAASSLEAAVADRPAVATEDSNTTRLLTNPYAKTQTVQPEPSGTTQPQGFLTSVNQQTQTNPLPPQVGDLAEQQHHETGRSKAVHGRNAVGVAWARYALDWQQKMERIGTYHFPEPARQQQLYGGPVLTVQINADGSLRSVSVARSSGHKLLDDAAKNIVRLAAPFAPFPPALASQYRSWEITRKWVFTNDNRLSSQ
jgi:protein TonB